MLNHLPVLEVLTITAGGSYPLVKNQPGCDGSAAVPAPGEAGLRCAGVAAVHPLCSQPGPVLWLPLRSEVTTIFTQT